MSLYAILFPLFFYINKYLNDDEYMVLILTCMHIFVTMTIIVTNLLFKTVYSSRHTKKVFLEFIKDVGVVISSFLMFMSTRTNYEYSFATLLISIMLRLLSLKSQSDVFSSRTFVEFLTFVTYGIACFYDSRLVANVYISCLTADTLYSSYDLISGINNFFYIVDPSCILPYNDKNKHLVIWFILKIYYLSCCFSSRDEIFIKVFHDIFGIIFFVHFMSQMLNIKILFSSELEEFEELHKKINTNLLIFIFVLTMLFLANFVFLIKSILFFSFVCYIFFSDSELPFNLKSKVFVFDCIFMYILLKNLITY